jgi:hypothetical protein
VREVLEQFLGPVDRLVPVTRGYTHNERAIAFLPGGRSVFVKRAVDELTAAWLRSEFAMYEALSGTGFAPELLGWFDSDHPVLVLEDLSDQVWPPPWDTGRIDAVLTTLAEVARIEPPDQLPLLRDDGGGEGWQHVLASPEEFLALGLGDAGWLDRAGPELCSAAAGSPLAGRCLLHGDVRSDNLCLRGGRAVLFDWNLAQVGNPDVDLAFWLPSLTHEGGPSPERVMPECPPGLAAHVAGFFAARAGQPLIAHAPFVREVQLAQLRVALPWATRALGLEPPDPTLQRGDSR